MRKFLSLHFLCLSWLDLGLCELKKVQKFSENLSSLSEFLL